MKGYGLENPEIEADGFFTITFSRPSVSEKKDTIKDTIKNTIKISRNQRKILKEMSKNPHITAKQLAGILDILERNIKNNITKLKEYGLIKRVGSRKSGYWEVTEKE